MQFFSIKKSDQYKTKQSGATLFTVMGVGFFIISAVVSGGLFFYEANLEKNIAKLDKNLVSIADDLEIGNVETMKKLDDTIKVVKKIINNRMSISKVFDVFEKETLPGVHFSSFSFNADSGSVSMPARARTARIFAKQLAVFQSVPEFDSVSFENLSLEPDGTVNFSVAITMNKSLIKLDPKEIGSPRNTNIPSSLNINDETNMGIEEEGSLSNEINGEESSSLEGEGGDNITGENENGL